SLVLQSASPLYPPSLHDALPISDQFTRGGLIAEGQPVDEEVRYAAAGEFGHVLGHRSQGGPLSMVQLDDRPRHGRAPFLLPDLSPGCCLPLKPVIPRSHCLNVADDTNLSRCLPGLRYSAERRAAHVGDLRGDPFACRTGAARPDQATMSKAVDGALVTAREPVDEQIRLHAQGDLGAAASHRPQRRPLPMVEFVAPGHRCAFPRWSSTPV